ncbi:MAG: ABC transporter ATP-binding protein [Bacteroidia bacterium]
MINHEHQPYLSLRDKFTGIFKPTLPKEEFWALKDVSFDVYPGESIGIIGKNGAGKSTLLKILSKITPPTSGKIISRGRIASLLEVGTGFHPELTGRENIYMNGSILGMRRKEIQKNFDAIVDFAGVEKFIDTPLKHYSSGMQLRLAFAVAAFLENEILIIDEVLAVGDAEFQKKCMGKMEDVSKSGRTVLFVSHNIGAVRILCKKSILLNNGFLADFSDTNSTIEKYLQFGTHFHQTGKVKLKKDCIIKEVEVKCDGISTNILYSGCKFEFSITFDSNYLLDFPVLGLIFRDEYNQPVIGINNKHYSSNLIQKKISKGQMNLKIDFFPLYVGNYSIDLYFGEQHKDIEIHKNIITVKVELKGLPFGIEAPDQNYNKFIIKDAQWSIVEAQ